MTNALSRQEIANRFGFHKATIEGAEATMPVHADLRKSFENFANYLNEQLAPSREASLALTHLEDAAMWAHKAVARTAPLEANPEVPHVEKLVAQESHDGQHSVPDTLSNKYPNCTACKVLRDMLLPETATTPAEFANDLGPKESPVVFERESEQESYDQESVHRDFHTNYGKMDPTCPFCHRTAAVEAPGPLPKTASNG